MDEETRADYGTNTVLNFQITDKDGWKRTIKFNNPQTGENLQTAVTNFGDNFVLNPSANIVIGSKTGAEPLGYVADLVTTTRTKIAEGGEEYPLILSDYILGTTSSNPGSVEVLNAVGTVIGTHVMRTQPSGDMAATYDSETNRVTFTPAGGQVAPSNGMIFVFELTDQEGKKGYVAVQVGSIIP